MSEEHTGFVDKIASSLRELGISGSLIATWTAGFLLILAAFVLIAVVYHRASNRLEQNERSVAHTHEVLTNIERLISTVKDAETGQRGYLLTGSDAYLEPYDTAKANIDDQIAAVRTLVADNPGQVRRANTTAQLIHARFAVLDRSLEVRRVSGERAARALVLTGTGKEYMDRLRSLVAEMQREEQRLLAVRARNTESSHRQANLALWAATLTGLTLVIFVFWMFRRHLAALVREQQAHREAGVERAKMEGIIGSAMDAIISVDEDQKIVLFNRSAEKIFRCRASDAVGQPLDVFIPERFRARHRSDVRTFGQSGVTTRSMTSPGVLSGLRADGEEFPIEATISHIKVDGQRLFTVILRDVTDRKRTEEQLQQAQKLEAIGRLAGGVAHDFNNLLNIILGYSELLASVTPEDVASRHWVDQITASANSGALLTKQLLAFSRKQTIIPQHLDLARAVQDFRPTLRRLLPEDIELSILTSDLACPVKVDLGQIHQLLLNLIANARDAMPGGGSVTLEVRNVELDDSYAQLRHGIVPGKYVMLAVSDTGVGMAPEVAARVFEPFFTTKSTGQGTGLGLATVFGIAKQNGGDIQVYSEVGVGSVFKVYLPQSIAGAEVVPISAPATSALTGDETLLLVEDSLALRQLTHEVLTRAGYQVLEAEDGVHALQVSGEFTGDIDLLLTDVVMPRMRGTELAQKVLEQRPDIGIVLMSGYTEDTLLRDHGAIRTTVLEKPYTSESLLRTVRQVLDDRDVRIENVG